MARSSQVGRAGERRTQHIRLTRRESTPRTKLGAPLNRWIGAVSGQYLNFFDEDGDFTVEVSDMPDPDGDWSVQVGEDMRARLTDVQVAQLGGKNRDTLVFTLLKDGIASVEVVKEESAEDDTLKLFHLPDEVEERQTYIEGAVKQVTVNAYERDPEARRVCLSYYGTNCSVCGFSFEQYYGKIGKDFIQVHHLKPLWQIRGEYELDPVNDLRPVCPNCHAMLHRGQDSPRSIEKLKEVITARRRLSETRPRAVSRTPSKR